MNYDHLYHAGNHADVLKHLTLIALIQALSQKETPWCYLDTHAGAGLYDVARLKHGASSEQASGVQRLAASHDKRPTLCDEYLSMIAKVNEGSRLRFYPGSVHFVRQLAREKDRLIACELNHTVYTQLKKTFPHDAKVAIHHLDGYSGLKAFIPPKEKRGLVLIDPPYEEENDWKQVLASLELALGHWQSGHYLIWYPIKDKAHVMGWLRKLRARTEKEVLIIEMCPYLATGDQLHGSGLALINPVWKFSEQFEPVLAWLWHALSPKHQGYYRLLSLDSVLK